jgi:hypothetical protein
VILKNMKNCVPNNFSHWQHCQRTSNLKCFAYTEQRVLEGNTAVDREWQVWSVVIPGTNGAYFHVFNIGDAGYCAQYTKS